MSIIETSVKRPVAMSMLLLIVMVVGVIASISLPVDFLPDIEMPVLTVTTTYSGAGPEEVEVSVTRPLESVLSTVEGIQDITSTSMEGSSSISLEFAWGSDIDTAMFNTRESIDMVSSYLPDGAGSPRIFQFSTDIIPVLGFLISGIDDMATAYDIAENQVQKALEQVPGVGQVNIRGGTQTEVHIELTQNRLQAYNLDAETVAQIVAANDVSTSGGYVYQGSYRFGVRTDGELKTLEDFRNIVISYVSGTPIFLRDIADVYYGGNEDNSLLFVTAPDIEDESPTKAGRAGVMLTVSKSSGANTVEVEKEVKKKLEELRYSLPPSVEISEVMNTAKEINASMSNVTTSALQGGLFALLVIFFYLWDWRSVLVIGLSIPTSIIATFIAMFAAGTTFNVISMAGLTLAVGMMVDSSIVVLENIFRHRAEGQGKINASINGASEVGLAITASTFTTIAVFAPILFVEGMMGQLFKDLVVTVVVGLLSSLIISITLVPMLCSILIKEVHMEAFDTDEDVDHMSEDRLKKMQFNDRILHEVDVVYKHILEWCVKHKKTVVYGSNLIVIALVCFFASILPKEYMPVSDDGQFTISLTYPLGTRYEYNESLSRNILKDVRDFIGDDELVVTTLQVKATSGGPFGAVSEHKTSMRVTVVPRDQRDRTINEIVMGVQQIVNKYPVKNNISIGGGMGGRTGGEPITLQIQGNDLDVSHQVADQLITIMNSIEGIENPRNTSDDGVPEISLKPDRIALARAGLSPVSLFSMISTAFGGRVATTVLGPTGNDIDVRVRVRDEDRTSVDSLLNLNIPTSGGSFVPFSTLVDAKEDLGPSEIKRADSIRIICLKAGTSGIYEKDVTGAVHAIQQQISEKLFLPAGINIVFKGDYEDTQESMIALLAAFFVAIFVVYALMAAQFESYIAPFVIMISVPFGALGSMILLFLTGHSLNVYSMIGVVILVGIVINNGIVLIDYMNKLLAQRVDIDEAAVITGVRRIRPVCMTTFTTILGMFPMALGLGEGGDTYAPLATSVIGGLIVSTLFTLLVVPTAYSGIRKRFPFIIRED